MAHACRLPLLPPIYVRWLWGRALGVWLTLRAMLLVVYAGLGLAGATLHTAALAQSAFRIHLLVVGLATGLTLLETRRRHELLLFANAGVPLAVVVGTIALVPGLAELALAAWW